MRVKSTRISFLPSYHDLCDEIYFFQLYEGCDWNLVIPSNIYSKKHKITKQKIHGLGQLSDSQAAVESRERLRKLALETIDISKDPYFMRNHLGSYECKLCLTLHNNEGKKTFFNKLHLLIF